MASQMGNRATCITCTRGEAPAAWFLHFVVVRHSLEMRRIFRLLQPTQRSYFYVERFAVSPYPDASIWFVDTCSLGYRDTVSQGRFAGRFTGSLLMSLLNVCFIFGDGRACPGW